MATTEADKYEILERIGQGSFGLIRKVRRKADGLVMCRKEICYTKMSDKERHQLQAELNILRQLDHPNIVHYYEKEHHKESHDLHLYMEYCGNGDLGIMIKDLKARHALADEELVWTVFAQLVSALYRCHYGEDPPSPDTTAVGLSKNALPLRSKAACDRMILHRDLKPENVFLGEGNAVKLGDFGLSKIISSHDFASTYVGTPFYMSPEICAAERYSLYSDIWSLGCVIYELCSREPPFNAKTHFDLIQKIKLGKVAPLPRQYSRELSEVITACLQVNPNSRPDTAALLNLPRVKLIRKSQQSALVIQQYITAKDQAIEELKLAKDHILHLENERQTAYDEMNKKLHMEWEARAHLEINRRVDMAERQLTELLAQRVEEEVCRRMAMLPTSQNTSATSFSSGPNTSMTRSSTPTTLHPSPNTLPPLSEEADLSCLSLDDSPLRARPAPPPAKRSSRTPFTRARTIASAADMVPSPMDVQMRSPSPIRGSIAGLSLSPRRNEPTRQANIFATRGSTDLFIDADASDNESTPDSPLRPKAIPARPGHMRTKTMPSPFAAQVLSKKKSTPNVFAIAAEQPSNIPTRPSSAHALTSPVRRAPGAPAVSSPTARKVGMAATNTGSRRGAGVQGRTLVELSRNEVAGLQTRSAPVARWDPETEEMPSPFLVRGRKAMVSR